MRPTFSYDNCASVANCRLYLQSTRSARLSLPILASHACIPQVATPFATKPTGDAPAGPSSSIACTLGLSDTSTCSQCLQQLVVFQPPPDTVQDLEALADSEPSPLWLPEQSLESGEIRAQIWMPPTARSQLLTQRSVPAEFLGGAWTRLLHGPRRSRLRGLLRRTAETKLSLS